jgi:hypothetical protein
MLTRTEEFAALAMNGLLMGDPTWLGVHELLADHAWKIAHAMETKAREDERHEKLEFEEHTPKTLKGVIERIPVKSRTRVTLAKRTHQVLGSAEVPA